MKKTNSIKKLLAEAENVKLVNDLLEANKCKSRMILARYVCEQLDLRDTTGRLRTSTTLRALRELEVQGLWELPKPKHKKSSKGWNPRRLNEAVQAPQKVPASADEIEGLELIEV